MNASRSDVLTFYDAFVRTKTSWAPYGFVVARTVLAPPIETEDWLAVDARLRDVDERVASGEELYAYIALTVSYRKHLAWWLRRSKELRAAAVGRGLVRSSSWDWALRRLRRHLESTGESSFPLRADGTACA